MSEDEKDRYIRYLEAIIKDMMNNSDIKDFSNIRQKSYCQRCLSSFNRLGDTPIWKLIIDGLAYGICVLVFLFFVLIAIGIFFGKG